MTVASRVISALYPMVGGAGAALTTHAALQMGRRFVVGKSKTPSGGGSGGTASALVWTALSWAASVGVGLYTGNKLIRKPAELQPAQSKQ